MHDPYDAIVIGAGQAGLATGYHLKQAGLRFVLLEANQQPGGSWRKYYDSLTLFSPARYSSLPGLPFPGNPDRYPSRDEVVSYLRECAVRFELPVIADAKVQQVERLESAFLLRTAKADEYRSHALVGASGSLYSPNVPCLPGQDRFKGTILHSVSYKNPEPFRGKRVLVVGATNSATVLSPLTAAKATCALKVVP